ncbi:MAG TPA: phosphoribosyltransferase family protein, partial [Acidimicrobiales bacterium]|nr:phosphoribosyltransferase family protein [Acidimicrobiales bacterium]
MRFEDRAGAGRALAEQLDRLELADPVVLGLPRGGVPVAAEVARALGAPLDVFVARKVGAPGHEEYGIGAVAEGGVRVADEAILPRLGITPDVFDRLAARADAEVVANVERFRQGRPLPRISGRVVVLVDDGLATGMTALAALRALRRLQPARLVLGEPVCAASAVRQLEEEADDIECVHQPEEFHAVGAWYVD